MKINKTKSTTFLFAVVFLVFAFAFVSGVPVSADDGPNLEQELNTLNNTIGNINKRLKDLEDNKLPKIQSDIDKKADKSSQSAISAQELNTLKNKIESIETRLNDLESRRSSLANASGNQGNNKYDDHPYLAPKQEDSNQSKQLPIILIAALILAAVFMILIFVLFFFVIKTKKNVGKIVGDFKNVPSQLSAIDNKMKKLESGIGSSNSSSATHYASKEDIENINRRISEIAGKQQNFETSVKRHESEPLRTRSEPQDIPNGRLDLFSVFNNWAANPQSPLPSTFAYLEGEFRIRTTQDIKITGTTTKWITDANRKYLYPNPNSFDDMTNITELYKMDLGALKPKGQNRIKIVKPCEISGTGFIQDRGELRIL